MIDNDIEAMMTTLLERAKETRASFKYSEDEKMIPMAFVFTDEAVEIIAMQWRNTREKCQMATMANQEARKRKAKSLSFVTDSRWVKSNVFCEYYGLPHPRAEDMDQFQKTYYRILREHGGEIKNLPRPIWEEAVIVFTNGPGIPLQVKMLPYREGENDTIEWMPQPLKGYDGFRCDMLTDWWK
jgi:hypothetical protein